MKIVTGCASQPPIFTNGQLRAGRVYRFHNTSGEISGYYVVDLVSRRYISLESGESGSLSCDAFRWIEVPNAEKKPWDTCTSVLTRRPVDDANVVSTSIPYLNWSSAGG